MTSDVNIGSLTSSKIKKEIKPWRFLIEQFQTTLQHSNCPVFSVAVMVSTPAPVVLKRQKKDNIPQSVFTIPPELDVSLLLEFVG